MSQYVEKDTAYFNWNRSQDISPYLPRTADRICEIGCATGSTLASLKRRYDASFAAGFDIDEQSIAIARGHLDRAEVIDMESTQLPNYINDIDLFLCLDVLEHLKDPWTVVKTLHARMRVGGSIVASIPNVQHYSVSMALLFAGKWELANAGLLDRTHLRFFVRRTAIELMTSSGLRMEAIGPTYGRRLDRAVAILSAGLLTNICALQYIVRVTRAK
jgi:2-polyprenyl-3-methyl-5-hydroxy-6-metoxy-1,4-benzoquinol methylase